MGFSRIHLLAAAIILTVVGAIVVALGFASLAAALVGVTGALSMLLVLARALDFTPWVSRRARAPPSSTERRKLHDLFAASLEVPTADRANFLAHATAGHSGLRREVQSLLQAHAEPGVLDRPVADLPRLSRKLADAALRPPGWRIGRYEIMEKLGGGGMGVVYRARDHRLERIVALKFLSPHLSADEEAKRRLLAEAQSAAALDHPNICTVHEIGETAEGDLFIAMPCYDGETLKHRLSRAVMEANEVLSVALQVARGLAAAHDLGIVHRDIKPANLILTRAGVVKIVDFGIARGADLALTNAGVVRGTTAYMSPEQARGEPPDARADLWSLGVVLYEMLTGERPFRGATDALVLQHVESSRHAELKHLQEGVPAELTAVVDRLLEKSRDDRYPTAHALVEALNAVVAARQDAAADRVSGRAPAGAPVAVDPTGEPGVTARAVVQEGEQRQATTVASTLSGYRELIERLRPEEADGLVGSLRRAAAEIAAAHGGRLYHFAGDQIVLIFGIPLTREDDAVRAVRSALDLHARVRAASDIAENAGGPPLRLHTGIETGLIVVRPPSEEEPGQAFRIAGSASHVAVRLAAHAQHDQVWVSPECHQLIAHGFRTQSREPIAFRDRREPVIPFQVLGPAEAPTRLEAAGKAGLTDHIGRVEELARLKRCLGDALQGEGQFVTITGEPGIGKSRLLHEFRDTAQGEPAAWLVGRCQSDGGGVPYLPFIEILRSVLRVQDDGAAGDSARVVDRIRATGSELEEHIPLYLHLLSLPSSDFPVPAHLEGEAFRLAMQEAIAGILTLSARHMPAVVILEDWHWADEASHATLRQVVEVVPAHPLLVLVSCRTGHAVEWGTATERVAIHLRPLNEVSITAMARSFLHVRRFPEDLGALLYERTGGNPFFLEEICQALLEEGSITLEGDEARLAGSLQLLDLPISIHAVIRARLDRVDPIARAVLRLASVVGREFTRTVLERTAGGAEALRNALDTLKRAGLIQQVQVAPEARYRFKHVLTQEVVYSCLLEHQRRELHGRIGELIEELERDRIEEQLDRLAHHFSRAQAWEKAVQYGIRSAEHAGALAQYAEALQILERTQRWLGNIAVESVRQPAAVDILLRQERLCETLGLSGRQQQIINELLRVLEPSGDRATVAEVHLRQGDLYTLQRKFPAGDRALRRSRRIWQELHDDDGTRKALRSLGLLRWHEGRNEEALVFIEEAIAVDRERQDVRALVGDLARLANVLKTMGEGRQARLRLEEALALADREIAIGSPNSADLQVKQAYMLHALAYIQREAGALDEALTHINRSARIAEQKRLPILSYHATFAAHIYLKQGKIEQSLARYRDAVALTRKAKFAPGLAQTLRIRGEVLLGLKRYADARTSLEEAAALFTQLGDRDSEALMWSAIARAHAGERSHDRARDAWSRARALYAEMADAAGEMEALEGLGASARAADPGRALSYYREALALAGSLDDPGAEASLRNTIGILEWERGDYTRALEEFERALTLFRGLRDDGGAGLMLNSVAATLGRLGRVSEARSLFEEAIEHHRESGQRQLEGYALAALGDMCVERGDVDGGVEYYRLSLAIRRAIADRRGEGWMLHNLSRLLGAGRARMQMAKEARRIAESCGDAELMSACTQLPHTFDN